MPLKEIGAVQQEKNGTEKRWFQDDYFDLIVWFDKKKNIVAFELCYDRLFDEHVLVWRALSGYSHYKVDSGEESALKNRSPIAVSDGVFNAEKLLEDFLKSSTALETQVARFIADTIAKIPQ
jgi:hypothetical protein